MIIKDWNMNFMEHKNLKCSAPCSMYSVLLDHKLIDDPFYSDNEERISHLSENDCSFYSEFEIDAEKMNCEYLELNFFGLDTICDIYFNGAFLAHTENMHRKYTYNIKELAQTGTNRIELFFKSPVKYFKEMNNKHFLYTNADTIPGAAHLRKALYMSGWDWGPTLPDMGIFRDVELSAYNTDKIANTVIHQTHRKNAVDLTFDITTLKNSGNDVFVEIDGKKVKIDSSRTVVTIENPKLWWVRGYGEHPLYDITFTLEKDNRIIDIQKKRIGLRTLTVSTAPVKDGNEFCFVNNGVKIFAMGANYIPQDSLYARITPETTKKRIDDFLFANYNCIRVWGGGYYPEDFFFDMCDEEGIAVWEDFMVACANVWLRKDMEEQFIKEAVYNLNRISHHASLAILCGNNEMELAIIDHWGGQDSELVRMDYLKLYERILPDLCEKYAPDTFYWPASPSCGGGFDNPRDPSRGDVHYWMVWHGGIPFEEYRKHKFRFCSEYGFESFPSIKTIKSFAEKNDLNPFSKIMENHQKCKSGNSKILMYLASKYLYPYSFENLVYASQILQAEAIKLGVEHFRRIRGYCMGSIYWQANDCWPVASWSSIDYYGRYKALHYAARKFYAPVAEGIFREDNNIIVNVSNETMDEKKVTVKWGISKNDNSIVKSGSAEKRIEKLSSCDVLGINLGKIDADDTYFYADLYDDNGNFIMRQTELFVPPKRFKWPEPNITVSAKDSDRGVELYVKSDKFAKNVEIDFANHDIILSDNYIDITDKNEYRIICNTNLRANELLSDITIKSVYDIR